MQIIDFRKKAEEIAEISKLLERKHGKKLQKILGKVLKTSKTKYGNIGLFESFVVDQLFKLIDSKLSGHEANSTIVCVVFSAVVMADLSLPALSQLKEIVDTRYKAGKAMWDQSYSGVQFITKDNGIVN